MESCSETRLATVLLLMKSELHTFWDTADMHIGYGVGRYGCDQWWGGGYLEIRSKMGSAGYEPNMLRETEDANRTLSGHPNPYPHTYLVGGTFPQFSCFLLFITSTDHIQGMLRGWDTLCTGCEGPCLHENVSRIRRLWNARVHGLRVVYNIVYCM